MSSSNQVLNTGQQATTNYDVAKLLIGDNEFTTADFTNGDYDTVSLTAGMVMGRIAADQEVAIMKSGSSDGSQIPRFILAQTIDVESGETVSLTLCTSGRINADEITLDGSDTLDTLVSGVSIRDRIAGDSVGLVLVESTSNTSYDNN